MQPSENNAEIKLDSEGEPISPKFKNKINKKIILLIVTVIVVLGAIVSYFLFFSNKKDISVPVLEDEKTEEVKIDKELDSDQDGLPDYIEKILGTDENNSDTDGDSYSDFEEIKNGYDPLNEKKYTEEEWEAVREEISDEDEGLFKKVFETSSIVAMKKCELPEKIGNYIKREISNIPTQEAESPKGILSAVLISYSDWNIISISNFDTEENAKVNLEESRAMFEMRQCNIGGITGLCKTEYVDSVGDGKTEIKLNTVESNFAWRELKTVKTITVLIQGDTTKSIDNMNKQAVENLILFSSKFQNCELNLPTN